MDAPSSGLLGGNGDQKNSRNQPFEQRRPSSEAVPTLATFEETLAALSASDRMEVLHWIMSCGLLDLAHARGLEAAAKMAYRSGDMPATGVR